MSGWASNPDKQPWSYGEPYTSINRATLKLKARMTPYLYTLSRTAYDTGVPPVRAALLEFPTDEQLYSNSTTTAFQFMAGPWLLVAPVYSSGQIRRDIRLPGGEAAWWCDYWDGTITPGGTTIDEYPAPLATLPLFVRAGAILPTWPPFNHFDAAPHDEIILELWPEGSTAFTLYEDDGVTRAALPPSSQYATTPISVAAPPGYLRGARSAAANVTIAVGGALGQYDGMPDARRWTLNVRCKTPPVEVVLQTGGAGGQQLGLSESIVPKAGSVAELESKQSGWFHDRALQHGAGGLLMVKIAPMDTAAPFQVTLSQGRAFPHAVAKPCASSGSSLAQRFSFNASSARIVSASGSCLTVGQDLDPDSRTKAVEAQPCGGTKAAVQRWGLKASGQIYSLSSDGKQCVDQDMEDSGIEMYGCHDQGSPGNQAWDLPGGGVDPLGPIVSRQNGKCIELEGI